jgi:predicted Rossmann fold nucleotide-binding protein DprA/Smf involved in DNA uptake
MLTVQLSENDPAYPSIVRTVCGEDFPPAVAVSGKLDLLGRPKLALFCSGSFPAELLPQIDDFIQTIKQKTLAVISGFHSSGESYCLGQLLSARQPVIICPARSLDKMRVRKNYNEALEEGRLLFVSFFRSHRHRSDLEMALRRNRLVAALADKVLVPYAAAGSKTEQFCKEIVGSRKPVFTIESDLTRNLISLGLKPFRIDELIN